MTSEVASHRLPLRFTAIVLALLACMAAMALLPASARADELEDLQEQVAETAEAYDEAKAAVDELQEQIDANQARIEEIEAQLPEQKERAAESMRVLYKLQQSSGSLIELLLSSEDFYELIETIQYLDIIASYNADSVDDLLSLVEELESTQDGLDAQMAAAEAALEEAQAASDEAVAAQEALEEQLAAEAAAQAQAEADAIAAAEKAAAAAADNGESLTTVNGNTVLVESPTADTEEAEENPDDEVDDTSSSSSTTSSSNGMTSSGDIDWSLSKDDFVSIWGARIDSYLSGSTLSGYGTTFAEAAYNYHVDPRLSPAIAYVESTLGAYCFKPYNAWGWGSSSWSSWSEAIWAHVSGLARVYPSGFSYSMAQKYCPPNADYWYSTVKAQINKM